MAKQSRINKLKTSTQRMKQRSQVIVVQHDQWQQILNIVTGVLFNNADKHGLRLKEDIFKPLNIELPEKEEEKVWDVIVNSGLVNPMMGFGNAGKLELTSEGIKMMTQFGSYANFYNQMQMKQNAQMIMPATHPTILEKSDADEQPNEDQQKPNEDQPEKK